MVCECFFFFFFFFFFSIVNIDVSVQHCVKVSVLFTALIKRGCSYINKSKKCQSMRSHVSPSLSGLCVMVTYISHL